MTKLDVYDQSIRRSSLTAFCYISRIFDLERLAITEKLMTLKVDHSRSWVIALFHINMFYSY